MNANVKIDKQGEKIIVVLNHSLDKAIYDFPLTLKTYVDTGWKNVSIKQGTKSVQVQPLVDKKGSYVLYQALANGRPIEVSSGK